MDPCIISLEKWVELHVSCPYIVDFFCTIPWSKLCIVIIDYWRPEVRWLCLPFSRTVTGFIPSFVVSILVLLHMSEMLRLDELSFSWLLWFSFQADLSAWISLSWDCVYDRNELVIHSGFWDMSLKCTLTNSQQWQRDVTIFCRLT